jgi:23S rRNA (cytidine1920-2'-O)/16S rRNA (cytidine1409-2'-O)-methyltransferase
LKQLLSSSSKNVYKTTQRRLDVELVKQELARSRTFAKQLVNAGEVRVNGKIARKAALEVGPNDSIELVYPSPGDNATANIHFVSRSAVKLLHALENFSIDPVDAICLDIGASTGGFTQVLLRKGARKIIALDVGREQLTEELLHDQRVINLPGMNIRNLQAEDIEGLLPAYPPPIKFGIITADVSFISLELVLPKIKEFLHPNGTAIVLIKPQFELGRKLLNKTKNAVITDSKLQLKACEKIIARAQSLNLTIDQPIPSPILGERGNQEFLAKVQMHKAELKSQIQR